MIDEAPQIATTKNVKMAPTATQSVTASSGLATTFLAAPLSALVERSSSAAVLSLPCSSSRPSPSNFFVESHYLVSFSAFFFFS